jgi:hypothetical protein
MLFKRILLGGIGLAIVWLVFLTVPLWLRNVDHPLAANAAVDVCAYLGDTVLVTLPRRPESIVRGAPGDPDTGKPACQVVLPPASGRATETPNIVVMVSTERMLTADRRPVRTDRFVDTWLKESGASGSEVTPVKGPWRRAAVIQEPMRPGKLGLLADDAGVALWVTGQDIDAAAFVAFCEAVTRALRGKPATAAAR